MEKIGPSVDDQAVSLSHDGTTIIIDTYNRTLPALCWSGGGVSRCLASRCKVQREYRSTLEAIYTFPLPLVVMVTFPGGTLFPRS